MWGFRFPCLGVITFIIFQAHAQDSVSVSDFRYPETTAKDWKAGLSGDFKNNKGGRESASNSRLTVSNRDDLDFRFNANTSFLLFHVNEVHTFDLKAFSFFNYSTSEVNEVTSTNTFVDISNKKSQHRQWYLTLSSSYLRYLQESGVHLFGTYDLSYEIWHSKYNQNYSGGEDVSTSITFEDEGVLGIGYGRIRDGTFVIQALRIIQRLLEDGIITSVMTREQILSLVNRVAHKREYTTNYERYEKYLVQDIVEELKDTGILDSNEVTAFSSLRIAEGLREKIEPRFFGWRAAYGFGAHGHIQKYYSGTTSAIDPLNGDSFFHQITAEGGYPITLYTHIHSELSIEVPNIRPDLFTRINFNSNLTYQIGEKLDVQLEYKYSKNDNDRYERTFSHTVSTLFIYFLEDQVRFTTKVDYIDIKHDYPYASPTNYYKINRASGFSFSFGLTYNIM